MKIVCSAVLRLLYAYLEGNVFILCKEHFQLTDTDPKVPICVFVGNVESEWTELASLKTDAVEETERLEQMTENCILQLSTKDNNPNKF